MSAVAAVVAAACGVAAWLALPAPPSRRPVRGPTLQRDRPPDAGRLRRWRPVWSGLAGAGAAVVVGGPTGLVLGALAAVGTWVVATRAEAPGERRRREEVARGLPHVVGLLAAALTAGQAPAPAVRLVCTALPGAAADRLGPVATRLSWGGDPGEVWSDLAADPDLAPLGRTMARAHASGAPVATAVERLGVELARQARADVEDRARAVGVKAAVPLGVCLLPAFLLVGIVPLVAGLLTSLRW